MNKFKVGDKVVIVDGGYGLDLSDLCNLGIVINDTVLTIKAIKGGRATFKEVDGCDAYTLYKGIHLTGLKSADTTQQKRAELKAAIELVQSYKIITTASQAYVNSDATYTFNTMGGGSLGWTGLEGLLDKLLPLESPQQKKLKELEKQQLEIVAKMEQLRSEL